jgi:hypothetical protein
MLSRSGHLGFIIPKPFIYASNWNKLRDITLPAMQLVVDVSKAWREVKLEQCIVVFSKQNIEPDYFCFVRNLTNFICLGKIDKNLVNEFGFILNGVTPEEVLLASRLKNNCVSLSVITTNKRGAMLQKQVSSEGKKIVLGGKHIQRWFLRPDSTKRLGGNLIADESAMIKQNSVLVQNIVAHIQNPVDHIKITATVIPDPLKNQYVILDTINQLECQSSVHHYYLCGLLNSKLVNWYVYRFLFAKAIRTMHFDSITTDKLIVPRPDKGNSKYQSSHDKIVSLVETMLDLNKRLAAAKTPNEKNMLQRQITATDSRIDRLVYDLYGLTGDEIKIVEEAN